MLRNAWRLLLALGVELSWLLSLEQVARSGVMRKGSPGLGYSGRRGTLRGKDRRITRCGFRDIRHISKGAFGLTFGTRGTLRSYIPKGVAKEISKAGFRDTRHSPKDGPEGVPTEASKGHSAGLQDSSERAYRSGFGDTCQTPKGLRRGV